MLDLAGSSWSSPTQAPPLDIVPPLADQPLHLMLLHPPPLDVLHLRHPLLLLRIDVTGLRSAKKQGDKKKCWRQLSSHAAIH
jgi:hypothetical protein